MQSVVKFFVQENSENSDFNENLFVLLKENHSGFLHVSNAILFGKFF